MCTVNRFFLGKSIELSKKFIMIDTKPREISQYRLDSLCKIECDIKVFATYRTMLLLAMESNIYFPPAKGRNAELRSQFVLTFTLLLLSQEARSD